MFNDLKETASLIIDDRSYPRGTVWTLINYLTNKSVTAAKGTTMIADNPDPAVETAQSNLWQLPVNTKFIYKGKIIILVNEITQSQAEYTCMVIQAAFKNTTIIGSQTAGADGDVTGIKIPGGIQTAFSGHGIHYPDGRPTQGIGIVPDIKISPTIKGIKENKDEVLERAISYASSGK
jgi:C-terminal processing protease CtpA/Prc